VLSGNELHDPNSGFSKNKPQMKLIISLYKLIIPNIIANMCT